MATPTTQETVTVGSREVRLLLPNSFAIRHEVVGCAAHNAARAFAAALAFCWSGPGRPKAVYTRHNCNPLQYGGAVVDELRGRGVDMAEIIEAGGRAFTLIADSLITASEVDTVEGFTEGQVGPLTS